MNLRNPWIDPRITRVSPDAVQHYLSRTGWHSVGPAANPHLLRFERPGDADGPTLFVPLHVDDGPGQQWLIELVGDLAVAEGRYAGDVITDILTDHAGAANGAASASVPELSGR